MPDSTPACRIGVDIGGTFTDIVLLDDDGAAQVRKVPSGGGGPQAIAAALADLFAAAGRPPGAASEVLHGTTVGSNAILELRGAKAGLIATRGFRDLLEIRNLRMPRLYDMAWEKPQPLIPRHLRLEVSERVAADGAVVVPLDRAGAERAVAALVAEGVDVIAVCLLNCFANDAHERALGALIEAAAPGLPYCLSCDVLPEIGEYERTSTTAINAYVMPKIRAWLADLRRDLDSAGVAAPLLLMQSNGGLTTDAAAAAQPCKIVESGPAGGAVGARAVAATLGESDVISFDMGGTTAKAASIESGALARCREFAVGGGIMVGSRLLTGAGYLLKTPAIDLAEVGAGGGSLIRIDAAGSLRVGPESAGADPGPVAYARGGDRPTVTDANILLGYLNPDRLVGGALRLDKARAEAAFAARVARPMGLSVERAAWGAHAIAASNMIRAIKAVSSERGRDPRGFALFAFGGNGPLFAAGMAESLGMSRIIVPPAPGVFSAFGMLYADVEHHYARTLNRVLAEVDPGVLTAEWDKLADEARRQLRSDGFPASRIRIRRAAAMHYKGQIYELTVPAPDGAFDGAGIAALEEAFGVEHERTYGHRAGPDEPVVLVSMQVVGQGVPERPRMPRRLRLGGAAAAHAASRRAYFGDRGWLETPVIGRSDLATPRRGPAIVEEYDATTLIPPGWRGRLAGEGAIRLEREGQGEKHGHTQDRADGASDSAPQGGGDRGPDRS